ncbi:hypothetical protein Bpfe_029980, partial [Biomphalaria pfeifferi]
LAILHHSLKSTRVLGCGGWRLKVKGYVDFLPTVNNERISFINKGTSFFSLVVRVCWYLCEDNYISIDLIISFHHALHLVPVVFVNLWNSCLLRFEKDISTRTMHLPSEYNSGVSYLSNS